MLMSVIKNQNSRTCMMKKIKTLPSILMLTALSAVCDQEILVLCSK
jgi:hypothetical protein